MYRGHHGLVAYGCNTYVVVVDTINVQPVQCLDHHKSVVNKVEIFMKCYFNHNQNVVHINISIPFHFGGLCYSRENNTPDTTNRKYNFCSELDFSYAYQVTCLLYTSRCV